MGIGLQLVLGYVTRAVPRTWIWELDLRLVPGYGTRAMTSARIWD